MNIELDPVQPGTGWTLMLTCMTPLDDAERFAELRENVKGFVDWAAAELDLLNAMR